MDEREIGRLMRVARDKAEREIGKPEYLPGTVVQIVDDDETLPYPYARVHLDGPHPQHVTNDVPIIGAVTPVEGDRVMVRFDPPHGAVIDTGPLVTPDDEDLIPAARVYASGPPEFSLSPEVLPQFGVENRKWVRVPLPETDFEHDGLISDGYGLTIPTAGVYSARAQVLLEHWSSAAVRNASTGIQFWEGGSHELTRVYWEEEGGSVGEHAPGYDDELDPPEIMGIGFNYNGIVKISATVPYDLDEGVGVPSHDLQITVQIRVNEIVVAEKIEQVVPFGAGSVSLTASVDVGYSDTDDTVVTVRVKVDGDWGTTGDVFCHIGQTEQTDGGIVTVREEPVRRVMDWIHPITDARVALVLNTTDWNDDRSYVVLGTGAVEHVGQATNVAFEARAEDFIECWAYFDIDPEYGIKDLFVVSEPVSDDNGLDVDILGAGQATASNLAARTELSAHWVRTNTVQSPFPPPA